MQQRILSLLILTAAGASAAIVQAQTGSSPATFPGTGEGLVLLTGLGGAPLDGVDVKSAVVGQMLEIQVSSSNPSLQGAALLLGIGVVPLGSVPLPALPGLALDLGQPFASLILGLVDSANPVQLQLTVPPGLLGASVVLQGIALPGLGPAVVANGLIAASDGRRLDVPGSGGPLVITEDLRITPNDAGPQDGFGYDVWMSGGVLAVGAPFDDNIFPDSGSAYTFDAATGTQIRKFTGPVAANLNDNFGFSVAISGERLYVGAPRDDGGTAEPISGKIFRFNPLTGQSFPSLLPVATGSGGTIAHALGESTDLSSSFLVAGSRGDSAFFLGGGSVHIFNATTGAFLRKLFPSDPGMAINFGTSVAVSGTRVAVGAPFDSISGFQSGSAYLFDGATGQQLHKFAPTDAGPNDLVALFIEVEGNTVLLGAPFQDADDGTRDVGSVYLYDGITGNLVTKLESPQPNLDGRFGDGLAMSDKYILIGESLGKNSSGIDAGVIYVYDRATLALQYRLETSDGSSQDALGESIEIEGQRVFAGARGADFFGSLSGAAYLFTLP